MAEKSGIGWTKSTFNPWIGCTRVGPGCDHCYAAVSTPARSLGIKWGPGEPRRRTSAANWKLPLRWEKQAAASGEFWPVFCSSLADVFDNEVPDEWRRDLWDLIETTPHLTWLLLTKRIGNVMRMARTVGWLDRKNVWLGITVVNQEEADRDIPKLLQTPAHKRFVSYEPALGPVDFTNIDVRMVQVNPFTKSVLSGEVVGCIKPLETLDWIIVGGESDQPGAKARPFDVDWARLTVAQCKEAGVPVFVKQLGSAPRNWCAAQLEADYRFIAGCPSDHCDNFEAGEQSVECTFSLPRCVYLKDRAGADPSEWPEDLRVQEFPGGKVTA